MSVTTGLIKQLRGLGLTQVEIARRTGIPQPRLSKWESGRVPLIADDVLKLRDLVNELSVAGATLPPKRPRKRDRATAENARRRDDHLPQQTVGRPVPPPMPEYAGPERRKGQWNMAEPVTTGEIVERRKGDLRRGGREGAQ